MTDEKPPLLAPDAPSGGDALPVEPPYVEPTYEDDENTTTRLLRALFALVAGGLLAYAQWNSPFTPPGQFWNRWIWTSVVFNFVLPLGIVWMFFAQSITLQSWMRDQRNNAWSYGFGWFGVPHDLREDQIPPLLLKIGPFTFPKFWHLAFRNPQQFSVQKWKRYALMALGMWALMLLPLWFAAQNPDARANYSTYLPPVETARDWAMLLVSLVVYMWCWEWFFRGFLLFGIAQGLGPVAAILLQAAIFGFTHTGKPPLEMASSFVGGAILGALCWREKSFVPAFLTHALIHVTWVLLILR